VSVVLCGFVRKRRENLHKVSPARNTIRCLCVSRGSSGHARVHATFLPVFDSRFHGGIVIGQVH
jgi:hypothetical protein